PDLPWTYDEPFGDSSQIPTMLVSQLARKSVTVALSGDGGDEIFCGYNRYLWPRRVWNATSWVPLVLRRGMGKVLTGLPPAAVEMVTRPLSGSINRPHERVAKLARSLESASFEALYWNLLRPWPDAPRRVTGQGDPVRDSLPQELALGFPR